MRREDDMLKYMDLEFYISEGNGRTVLEGPDGLDLVLGPFIPQEEDRLEHDVERDYWIKENIHKAKLFIFGEPFETF